MKPEPRLSATMHPKSRIKKSIGQVPRDAAYLWNLKNMIQKNLITKQETDSQRTILWLPEGKVGEGYIGNWELTILEISTWVSFRRETHRGTENATHH